MIVQPSSGRRAFLILLWAAPLALALSIPNLGPIGALALVVVTLIFRRDVRLASLPMWWRGPFSSIALGVGAGAAMHIFVSVLMDPLLTRAFGAPPDLHSFDAVRGDVSAYIRLLALGVLFGGVAEELVFRGYAIGWGMSLFGGRWGFPIAALSAIAFGLAHSYQGATGMASTGLIGLMYGWVYLFAGRKLAPAMLSHMTLDVLGITELYIGHPLMAPIV